MLNMTFSINTIENINIFCASKDYLMLLRGNFSFVLLTPIGYPIQKTTHSRLKIKQNLFMSNIASRTNENQHCYATKKMYVYCALFSVYCVHSLVPLAFQLI